VKADAVGRDPAMGLTRTATTTWRAPGGRLILANFFSLTGPEVPDEIAVSTGRATLITVSNYFLAQAPIPDRISFLLLT
jgi:hypothetical protein